MSDQRRHEHVLDELPGTGAVPDGLAEEAGVLPSAPRRRWPIARRLAAAGVAASALAGATVALVGRSSASDAIVSLERAGLVSGDSFLGRDFDSLDLAVARVLPRVPPLGNRIASALSGLLGTGREPGLFGATRGRPACDTDGLFAALGRLPAGAQGVWARSAGLGDASEIDDFVGRLTSVQLRRDLRVTVHGLRDGRGTERQAIIEAGSGVLVDQTGTPRVRCTGGDPLTSPAGLGAVPESEAFAVERLAINPSARWVGFDPQEVVTVRSRGAVPLRALVLLDPVTGRLFERLIGTNGERDRDLPRLRLEEACLLASPSPSCRLAPSPAPRSGGEPAETEVLGVTIEHQPRPATGGAGGQGPASPPLGPTTPPAPTPTGPSTGPGQPAPTPTGPPSPPPTPTTPPTTEPPTGPPPPPEPPAPAEEPPLVSVAIGEVVKLDVGTDCTGTTTMDITLGCEPTGDGIVSITL